MEENKLQFIIISLLLNLSVPIKDNLVHTFHKVQVFVFFKFIFIEKESKKGSSDFMLVIRDTVKFERLFMLQDISKPPNQSSLGV